MVQSLSIGPMRRYGARAESWDAMELSVVVHRPVRSWSGWDSMFGLAGETSMGSIAIVSGVAMLGSRVVSSVELE